MAQARLYQSVLAVTRDGDLERSSELLAQADDLFGQDGDTWGVAMVRSRQSLVARFRGDHGTSLELAEEALALFRKTGDRFGVGHSLLGLGHTLLDVDQPQAAAEQFMAAIEPLQQIGNTWFISRALAGLASAAIAFGWLELAANVLGCADGLRERIGAPVYGPDRSRYERAREHLSETLERAEFESAYLAGHEALPERMIGAFHSRFER
jgi:tetratricopeptide (TPR) repeat protein